MSDKIFDGVKAFFEGIGKQVNLNSLLFAVLLVSIVAYFRSKSDVAFYLSIGSAAFLLVNLCVIYIPKIHKRTSDYIFRCHLNSARHQWQFLSHLDEPEKALILKLYKTYPNSCRCDKSSPVVISLHNCGAICGSSIGTVVRDRCYVNYSLQPWLKRGIDKNPDFIELLSK